MPLSPLEAAQLCIDTCQYFYPEYWRTTLTRDAYQRCLDDCSGLPATSGEAQGSWPADLVREVGQDIQPAIDAVAGAVRDVHRSIQTDLLLVGAVAALVYLTVRRLT